MQFGSGLGGSVVGGLYGGGGNPGSAGSAAAPAGTSGPTGRPALMAAAWGNSSDPGTVAGPVASWIAAGALAGLVFIYWALPR